MKKQGKFYQSITGVAVATVLILMVPLVAMQFTDEVAWGAADFIIVGTLLFGTGFSYVLVTRSAPNIAYKTAVGLALGAALFMIWANLAVGLIGAGPNPGNFMYIGVLAVGITGIMLSGFRPGGMERAMYATTGALVLVAAIALLANMQEYSGSSATQIVGVNGFFAALFFISGLLFHYAAKKTSPADEKSIG